MDNSFSAQDLEFQQQVREFFTTEFSDDLRDRIRSGKAIKTTSVEWQQKLNDRGWVAPDWPTEYGGTGWTPVQKFIFDTERCQVGAPDVVPFGLKMVGPVIYSFGSDAQKNKFLPKILNSEDWWCQGYSEPGAGSDLQGVRTSAKRDGDDYIINGSKTYITNGQNCDVVIVVAKTDPSQGAKGTSLLLVDAGTEGFERGRNLDKIGQHSADTSELFFSDVRVPKENLLGGEGRGFIHLMEELPQERLSIAVTSQAGAQRAFDEAVSYTKDRKAFGQTVFEFQNTKFTLAGLAAELQVGWAHLDWALRRHVAGELTTAEASSAKLWHSELQGRVCDAALQLHGGAGYMNEYLIARLWRDARVTRIFGGTSEIMKEVISRSL